MKKMRHCLQALVAALIIVAGGATLYAQDTLWVKKRNGRPYIAWQPRTGEDLFLLSKKFDVPPAVLADVNNLSYQSGLPGHAPVWIPVDNYNFIRVEGIIKSRPLFYKTAATERLSDVSRMVNVAQSSIQRWNNMAQQELKPGQVLQIGWISFDASQAPFAKSTSAAASTAPANAAPPAAGEAPPHKDTAARPVAAADTATASNAYEAAYEEQVNGMPSSSETGAAVFYSLKFKTAPGVYYAMHNTAEKGTIIKVTNPANGNFIYAKVIGAIPALSDYEHCIIAISSNAAKALMSQEKRMFCKLEYR